MYSHGAAEVGRAQWDFFGSKWDWTNRNSNSYELNSIQPKQDLDSSTKLMDEDTFHQVFNILVGDFTYTFIGHYKYDGNSENFTGKITWEGCEKEWTGVSGEENPWNECAVEETGAPYSV